MSRARKQYVAIALEADNSVINAVCHTASRRQAKKFCVVGVRHPERIAKLKIIRAEPRAIFPRPARY